MSITVGEPQERISAQQCRRCNYGRLEEVRRTEIHPRFWIVECRCLDCGSTCWKEDDQRSRLTSAN